MKLLQHLIAKGWMSFLGYNSKVTGSLGNTFVKNKYLYLGIATSEIHHRHLL